jgi:hypothetical protein
VREGFGPARNGARRDSHGAPLFQLGRLSATPGALALLAEIRDTGKPYSVQCAAKLDDPMSLIVPFIMRHAAGDWGDVSREDWKANDDALTSRTRVFSAYDLGEGRRLWIITEADRESTTVLLPDEY